MNKCLHCNQQKAEHAWEGHTEGRAKDFEREKMMRFDLKIKQ